MDYVRFSYGNSIYIILFHEMHNYWNFDEIKAFGCEMSLEISIFIHAPYETLYNVVIRSTLTFSKLISLSWIVKLV